MGYTKEPELASRALAFSISSAVRSQDTVSGVSSVAANPAHSQLAWQFFKDNFALFNERYGKGGFMLARLVSAVCSGFNRETEADEVTAYFAANPVPAADRAIKQSVEQIRSSAAWQARDLDAIREFLKQ